jgi:hypothetical protein
VLGTVIHTVVPATGRLRKEVHFSPWAQNHPEGLGQGLSGTGLACVQGTLGSILSTATKTNKPVNKQIYQPGQHRPHRHSSHFVLQQLKSALVSEGSPRGYLNKWEWPCSHLDNSGGCLELIEWSSLLILITHFTYKSTVAQKGLDIYCAVLCSIRKKIEV